MGFVVLHMEKAHGSDSGTTALPPTTDRKGKIIRWGYMGKQAAGTATAERQTDRQTARRRVFTGKIP